MCFFDILQKYRTKMPNLKFRERLKSMTSQISVETNQSSDYLNLLSETSRYSSPVEIFYFILLLLFKRHDWNLELLAKTAKQNKVP